MILVSLLALMLVVVLPTAMWFSMAPEAIGRWQPRVEGTDTIVRGQFRDAVVPHVTAGGPPLAVRLAALGSWVLGTMFVPGLCLGLYGLRIGIGVVSIPGLILAWQLFFLGRPLLLGKPEAAAKARSLARFARVLNYLVLAVCAVGVWFTAKSLLMPYHSEAWGALAGVLAVAAYAGISLGHASLLVRAAAAIDALHVAANDALSGVRLDASAVTGDLVTGDLVTGDLDAADEATRARRG